MTTPPPEDEGGGEGATRSRKAGGRKGGSKKVPSKTKKKRRAKTRTLVTIGWREWVALPGLDVARIKAKVDTGARSSTLHAYDFRRFRRRGRSLLAFKVHPLQRDFRTTVDAEAEVVEMRRVRSSSGAETLRPVILTEVALAGRRWEIELTLVRRDAMGFRMLLGRQAVRDYFLVDPGRSFVAGRAAAAPEGSR